MNDYIPYGGDLSTYGSGPEHQFFQIDAAQQAFNDAAAGATAQQPAPVADRTSRPVLDRDPSAFGGGLEGFGAADRFGQAYGRGQADLSLENVGRFGKNFSTIAGLATGNPLSILSAGVRLARDQPLIQDFEGYIGPTPGRVITGYSSYEKAQAADRRAHDLAQGQAFAHSMNRVDVGRHGGSMGGNARDHDVAEHGFGSRHGEKIARGGRVGEITAAKRAALPASTFGIPSRHAYPMPDRSHAANAKGRAKQQLNAGHLSREQYDHIVAMANRRLGKRYARGGVVGHIKSKTPGRADAVPTRAPQGTYIVPADVVSSLGQGNTAAGVAYLDRAVGGLTKGRRGGNYASGGQVPIQASGGEYAIHPDAVAALGGGSDELGAKKLDALIAQVRQQTARVMPNLPGPR